MITNKTQHLKKTLLLVSASAMFFSMSLVVHASVLIESSPVSGLAAYWTFDAKSIDWGSNLVTDVSGNGNTGTLVSMTAAGNQVAGKRAQGVYLDGNVDSVSLASNPITTVSNPSSVCAWANTNNISASSGGYNQTILNLYTNNNNGIHMGNIVTSGKFFASYRSGGTYYGAESTSQVFSNNTWVHVCYVWDGTGITLYANGASIASTTNTDSAGTVNTIGAHDDVGDGTWSGTIDDIRVYSRAISATEIQQIYKSGALVLNTATGRRVDLQKSTPNFMSSGLVGYWSFNNQDINWSTGKLIDRSGQGNDGQMLNLATTTAPVIGKLGQALTFNGTNAKIDMGLISNINAISTFSVSQWVKTDTDKQQTFSGKFNNGAGGWDFQTESAPNTTQALFVFYPGGNKGNTPAIITKNVWHHIVGVFDGNQTGNANRLKIYVDGVNQTLTFSGTIPASFTTTGGSFMLGGWSGGNSWFSGAMDETRIYNRALSASEVQALYNHGR